MHNPQVLSVAYHEAAHAVAAVVQGCPILGCQLWPDGESGRLNQPPFVPEKADPADLRKYAIIALAGWEAQLHYEPDLNPDLHAGSIEGDVQTARRCVGNAVASEEERQATLKQWRVEASRLVVENWPAIVRIGDALADRGSLTPDEIAALRDG
jgi:hypothetical protein